MDDERTMSFMARHRRNQRKQQDAVQAYIDRQALETGACLHCPWHSTGAACVLPRCLNPEPYKEAPNDLR